MESNQNAPRDATALTVPGLAPALALALACVMVLTDLGGAPLRDGLSLGRGPVLEGEVWRLVGAHLVNLSRTHTYLNIAGLALVCATLWPVLSGRGLARSVLVSGLVISTGLLALQPADVTYVGFSGITHGIFAYGGLMMAWHGPRGFAALILGCLAAKIGHEVWIGPVSGADDAIGGSVSMLSHALGVLGGALAANGTGLLPRVGVATLSIAAIAAHVA